MRFLAILLLSLLAFSGSARATSVSGTVTDSQNQPVPFCSVYLKGTTTGTTANIEGAYALEVLPGNYEIVFRSIGYKLAAQDIIVGTGSILLNVSMQPEAYQLREAVVNASAEDPAYAIIRKAIIQRKKYLEEVEEFSCRSYVKSTQRLIDYPKKFLGQAIDFGDLLDTVSRIFYLSESVADLSIKRPDKVKEVMVSSKVSGNSRGFSFNKSSDLLVSFYQNLITLGSLTPRGIVSPISATAMMYYDYRLEGSFTQHGEMVNKIKVIPKRRHDPVFTGDIYILEDSWRIHSLDLYISSDQQLQFIDTFRISETYIPVGRGVWMMLNSEFSYEFSGLGFRGKGLIIGVFSNYNVAPGFPPRFFTNEVLKINMEANKKDTVYWDEVRPVPLTLEENRDYTKRDSLFTAHNTKAYMDSIDKIRNKFTLTQFMLAGYRRENTYRNSAITVSGLAQNIQYNTVEGWVVGLTGRYYRSKGEEDRRYIMAIAESRYGFSNRHFNGSAIFRHSYSRVNRNYWQAGAGTQVSDFNSRAHFSPLVYTGYSLLAKRNWLKIYEKRFCEITHRSEVMNGLVIRATVNYSDRIPLVNTTDFAWVKIPERKFLSNDPLNPGTELYHFRRNQLFVADVHARMRFGQKYVTRPDGKSDIGSKYPELSLRYRKAIPEIAGSDADFDFAEAFISDDIRFGLLGSIRFTAGCGKFFSGRRVEFMDYHHFNGNRTIFADFSLSDFGLVDYYRFATKRDFIEAHGEYDLGGFILNKMPLLRKFKLREIIGAHYFYARYTGTTAVKNYYETSFGIEKFGLLRADFVLGFNDGRKARTGFLLGLKLNISNGAITLTD
jgi:hypothetical protein